MFLTIIAFIIVLSVLVFVHELGHFWMARRFGVKAEEFGFGFPPRAIGFQTWRQGRIKKISEEETVEIDVQTATTDNQTVIKETILDRIKNWGLVISERRWRIIRGNRSLQDGEDKFGTVYSLNWIPLGGFVKIKGENGECEADQDSFACRPAWQRFFILSAGVSMNVILAAVLISIGLMIGTPRLGDVGNNAQVINSFIQVAGVIENSPAAKAGLKTGDVILNIDNQDFASEEDLQNYVANHNGQPLEYRIKSEGIEKELKITPATMEETGRGGIGIEIAAVSIVKYPWYQAIWEGIKTTVYLVWAIIVAFYLLIKNLILGHGLGADIAGPVGIATMTGEAARMGLVYVLQFTALLSVNLAVINFLPFPALDGGRVLFIVLEKIKGRPVKREVEATLHYIGFALLLILIALITFHDISKFFHS